MGKNTKNFRQSGKSLSGNAGARAYAQINRAPWHQRLINYIGIRGKGGDTKNGQS